MTDLSGVQVIPRGAQDSAESPDLQQPTRLNWRGIANQDKQGDEWAAWKPKMSDEDAGNMLLGTRFDNLSPIQIRTAHRIGPERFAQARALRGAIEMGLPEDGISEAGKTLLKDYGSALVHEATAEFDAATYAQEHSPKSLLDYGIKAGAEFSDSLISLVPHVIYGTAALFSGKAPQSMNEAIGLDGIGSPRIGYYLGALDAKLSGSERPLSDEYARVVRGEEMIRGQMGMLGRASMTAAAGAGELVGLLGNTPLSVPSKAFGVAEKALRLDRIAAGVGKWSAEQTKWLPKLAGMALKESILPGARFAAWTGLADYVDPATGELKDGWQRAKSAAVSAAMMPVFMGLGALGAKAASAITGESKIIRGAFSQWLMDSSPEMKVAIAKAGEGSFAQAWGTFLRDGMPGVSVPLQKKLLANAVQSTIEGIGFSATDIGFWHDLNDAIHGDPEAMPKVLERVLSNGLMMSALRFGGSRNALSVREQERVQEAVQEAPQSTPEQATQKEEQPAEAAPEATGKPYDLSAEIKAAEDWLNTQTDPRVEADLLIHRAIQKAAEIPDTNRAEQERYLTYAARLYRWRDTGMEGPRSDFPGEKPADVAAWEKDVADRRAQVGTKAAEEAANVAAGREPNAPRPPKPISRFDLNVIARGLKGRVVEPRRAQEKTAPDAETTALIDEAKKLEASRAVEKKRIQQAERANEKDEARRLDADEKDEARRLDAEVQAATDGLRHRRDAELAEAKLALDGIGGPTAEEAVKLVYDKKNPPRLVTYQDGKYWTRPVFGDAAWKEMPAKKVLALANKKQPSEPIEHQLAVVNQIAKRVFDLADNLSGGERRLIVAALNLAAKVDRHSDPAINAALSMAEQILPSSWSESQLSTWAQMALRGFSPKAQQVLLNHFQITPQPKPERTKDVAKAEALAKKKAAQQERQQYAEKVANPKGKTVEQEVKDLDETALREFAGTMGIPTEGVSRKDIERALAEQGVDKIDVADENPESGLANLSTIQKVAASVALAGAGAGLYEAGLFQHPLAVSGALLLAAVPVLRRFWGNRLSESLPYFGDKATGEKLARVFQVDRDRAAENRKVFEPAVHKVREIAGENWMTKTGRKYLKAVRSLQKVRWDSKAKDSFGDDNMALWAGGFEPIPAAATKEERQVLEAVRDVLRVGADLIAKKGAWALNRATGKYFRARFNPDRAILPRLFTPDGFDVLMAPGSAAWTVLRDAIVKKSGITIKEAEQKLKIIASSEAFRRGGFEMTRLLPYLPSYLRVGGREIAILETRPYEYATRYADATALRLGFTETFGQEAAKSESGLTQDVARGVQLINPTPEQLANRKLIDDFIETSPDQARAIRALVATMRAHHGLAIDKPSTIMGDLWRADPGTFQHKVLRDYLHPAYSAWRAVKLTAAFIPQIFEPLGTPATLFGVSEMVQAAASTWYDVAFNHGKVQNEIRSLAEDVGGAADQPALRMGGLQLGKRTGHRASDIGKMIDMLAAPMTAANMVNDVILARAGKSALGQWEAGKMSAMSRSWWDDTLRLLDFDADQRSSLLSGKAPQELQNAFIRRLRKDIYGVRGKPDQGFLQQLRWSRALFAFQGWSSSNLRMWGKIAGDFASAFKDPSLTTGERLRRVSRFARHVAGKGVTHALSMMGYLGAFYGAAMWQAFQGNDDSETAKNFFERLGQFALAQEFGGPVIGAIMAAAMGTQSSFVDGIVQGSPLGSISSEAYHMVTGTGRYEGNKPGLRGIPGSLADYVIGMVPAANAIDTLAHDPGLKMAINRYYAIFPSKAGDSDKSERDEFLSAMGAIIRKIRRSGRTFKGMDMEAIKQDLMRALDAPPKGEAARKEWDLMSADERREGAAQRVVNSLKARQIWSRLSEEEQNLYVQKAGKENALALEQYDEMLGELVDFAKMAF